MKSVKSVLRYPGGKSRAVKHILPWIPEQTQVLVSPFFGGGSIEFAWAAANPGGRVLACEKFEPLAVFWQQALRDPVPIADAAEKLRQRMTRGRFRHLQGLHTTIQHPATMAAVYYSLNRSSFSGATLSGGASDEAIKKRFTKSSIDRLRAFSAPNVDVWQDDAVRWLKPVLRDLYRRRLLPNRVFIYLDPPYFAASGLYGHNGSTHDDFNHAKLAEVLRRLDGLGVRWLLSYDDVKAVRELYSRYAITTPAWSYCMSADKASKEVLIFSTAMEDAA